MRILRDLAVDQATGVSRAADVSFSDAYKHCEAWCEAFFPAYQRDNSDGTCFRLHDLQTAWWSIMSRAKRLVPRDEWPDEWPPIE